MTEIDRAASVPGAVADGLEHARAHGDPSPLGSRMVYFPIASSTNDLAVKLLLQGTPDGTLVVAGQQTAGRGRGGHDWFSPPGSGLYVSMVLDAHQKHSGDWVHALTLATGVAMAEGLHAASGLPVVIKWPNDLVMAPAGTVRGARKLAGILAEAQADAGTLSHVIVGVGVNVGPAAWPPEISARATSLEEELGRPVDPAVVLGACLARIGTWVQRLRTGQSAIVRMRWQQLAVGATGATVEIAHADGPRRGVTCGIDGDGALLVRHGAETERVLAGEVIWL